MAGVFISYRRSDSAAFAGRIADYFAYNYPDIRVFFDVNAIEPGQDFVQAIRSRIESSEVVLAMIGESWLNAADGSGSRRIDDPQDFVRLELATALSLGARVIPVLLDSAQMPGEQDLPADMASLARCNAQFVRGAAFQRDAEHLGNFVNEFLTSSTKPVTVAPQAEARNVNSEVKSSLVSAFEQFRDHVDQNSFMICENDQGQFIQYARTGPESVELDLPTNPLNPQQVVAAQRLLHESYDATQNDIGGGDFTFNLSLPMDPAYLSHITLDVFEHVYGLLPSAPLKVQIDSF